MDAPNSDLLAGRSFGEDVSAWPGLKIARAIQHLKDLEGRISTWGAGKPFTTERIITEDRLRWETRIKVNNPPPLFEWSLILGDCFNALRASLDSCVWELAHLNGATPPKPAGLGLPIVTDESRWEQLKRDKLQTVPEEIAARIQVLQPFGRAVQEINHDPLVVLSLLNNIDKHRSNIAVNIVCNRIGMDLIIKWEAPDARERNLPPQIVPHAPEVVDGELLMEYISRDRIAEVQGGCSFGFDFTLETVNGREELFKLTQGLIQYVQTIHVSLLGGLVKDEKAIRS